MKHLESERVNQEVKSVSDLCNCLEIAREDDEKKARPKTAWKIYN